MKHAWNLWAKAVGEKTGNNDRDADRVAIIRTIIVVVNFITCLFIMANTINHWG
jgi:hypothetical protein